MKNQKGTLKCVSEDVDGGSELSDKVIVVRCAVNQVGNILKTNETEG